MAFESGEKKEIPHDCNWKFIVENVIDNKHCTPVHSKTLGSMGYCFEKPEVKFDEYNSLFKIPTEPQNRSEFKKIKLLKKMFLNSNVEAPYTHYLIFPNLTLSVFNGSLLTIGNIRPLNSKSSIYETHYLLPKVGQETNRILFNSIKENHVKSAIQIFEEDRLMLNKLSNHLEIINKPGFHFKEETRIHHFHKVYTKAINM
jgi:phenylpropionate dioxygenase-like ring-hydroxylating dioxygenase large terminal subunit